MEKEPAECKTPEVLAAEGWKQAAVSGGPHLKRMLEMYQEMGIEVYTEEVDPKSCDGCTVCYQSGGEKMYRVYTRQCDS